ncbi:glutamate--tRNA ligase [Enterobacterales bacterium endosymbiont of Anomoneura mori]|uniref:glutamate--tRNA ligase n=1 Tax=Enterobacterales bacterium endosymbiont of Anomoneura mori TaxID=3132096 RepID=UPI00399D25FA
MKIITRFAPSPTGLLHIGGARTALYSWLLSRCNKGKFILRIEDTDIKRSNIKSINSILEGLKWLKINWDKGPFFQSNNLYRYKKVIYKMLKQGSAYKCYCSKERLKKLRNYQIINNIKPRYDKFCLYKNIKNIKNKKYVVRFCNPEKGNVFFNDEIRGLIKVNNKELDDLIICRENNIPTYNFCSIIDDLDMNITHIIRGVEHINNTPRQINILKQLGAKIPKYFHVSLILGNDGKKLSKRYNINSINEYKKNGYLSEALINYIFKLGWSYKNKEIFTLKDMIKYFNIKNFIKSSSIFDIKKLNWINRYYINNIDIKKIKFKILPYFKKKNININNKKNLKKIIKLFIKHSNNLNEIVDSCNYIYNNNIILNYKIIEKIIKKKNNLKLFIIIYNKIKKINFWSYNNIKNIIKKIKNEFYLNMYDICMPLRIVITGKINTPDINNIIYLIKKKNFLYRLNNIINLFY